MINVAVHMFDEHILTFIHMYMLDTCTVLYDMYSIYSIMICLVCTTG